MSEYRDLVIQNKVLKEQNEKLQGSIKALSATGERMIIKLKDFEKKQKEYKDAFETIFVYNMSPLWDKVSDDEKKKMSITEKAAFFNQKFNELKIQLKNIMGEKVIEAYDVIQKLTTTNKQLEAINKKYLNNMFNYFKQEGLSSGYDASKAEKYATEKIKNVLNIKNFEQSKNNNVSNNQNYSQSNNNIKQTSQNIQTNKKQNNVKKNDEYFPLTEISNIINKTNEVIKQNPDISSQWSDLLNELNNKSNKYKDIIFYIAETGEYRKNQVKDKFNLSNYEELKKLVEWGLLVEGDKLPSHGKGAPSTPIQLSNLGIYYIYQMGIHNIHKPLLDSVAQKSPEHSDYINKVTTFLSQQGYEYQQEVENSVDENSSSICDILATKNNLSFRIEVEIGKGSPSHYVEKIVKIIKSGGKDIIFITDNRTSILRALAKALNDTGYLKTDFYCFIGSLDEFKKIDLVTQKRSYLSRQM